MAYKLFIQTFLFDLGSTNHKVTLIYQLNIAKRQASQSITKNRL